MWVKTDKTSYTHVPSGATLMADLSNDESSVDLCTDRVTPLAKGLTEVAALSVLDRLVNESGEEVIRWLDVTQT